MMKYIHTQQLQKAMKDECYQFLKNDFGKVEIVGFGSYGQVKLARNTQNNQIVAIKMIHNKNAKEQIDVHHKLNHPNIIKLLNYYYEQDKNITYMVLEYASGGSLHQKIKFGYGQLSKNLIRRYFRDICEAVAYLHSKNYMHRDIKTQNILITSDNHAKLCDFGFASIVEYRSTLCGTFQYMAPEMIQKKPYDYKIDIWGLGILLFELIQGYAPFRGQTGQEVIAEMKKSLIFSNRFDPIEIDIIKKILRVNAQNRPEVAQILDHSYFKQDEDTSRSKETTETSQEKSLKSIKDLKEASGTDFKEKIQTQQNKKKQGEKKFQFFHRKQEAKKQENAKKGDKFQNQFKIQKKEPEKKQTFKEFPKEEYKKEDSKRDFKPFVPANFQNPVKNLIKPPNNPGFGTFNPVSPSGFPQNPQPTNPSHHQFNSSMQSPPTYQHGSFPTSHPQNPNASMTTATTKHFPMGNQAQTSSFPNTNINKTAGQSHNQESRPASGQTTQQSFPGHIWKKN